MEKHELNRCQPKIKKNPGHFEVISRSYSFAPKRVQNCMELIHTFSRRHARPSIDQNTSTNKRLTEVLITLHYHVVIIGTYPLIFLALLNHCRSQHLSISPCAPKASDASTYRKFQPTKPTPPINPIAPNRIHTNRIHSHQRHFPLGFRERFHGMKRTDRNAMVSADVARHDAYLPSCLDTIEVLWEMETGSLVWWRAEVVSLIPIFAGTVLAIGTILYEKRPGFATQMSEVEFILGQLVRPKRRSMDDIDHPENSWKEFQGDGGYECEDWGDAQRTMKQTNSSERRMCRTYCPNLGSEPKVKRACTRNNTSGEESGQDEEIHDTSRITQVEKATDMCLQRLENLERSLQVNRTKELCTTNREKLFTLKGFMRRAVLQQLQKPFRRSNTGSGIVDGGHAVGFVAAHVYCTLKDFASLSMDASNSQLQAMFFPSLTAIQSISLATRSSHILFPTLGSLCAWMGINDRTDRETMLIREGKSSRTRDIMSRVLGVLVDSADGERKSNIQYYIGRSVCRSKSSQTVQVLQRESMEWDPQNDAFVHKLQAVDEELVEANILDGNEDVEDLKSKSFYVMWKRTTDLSKRMWTEDACRDSGDIFGEVHVVLPALYFFSPKVCLEVDDLLTYKFCDDLLE